MCMWADMFNIKELWGGGGWDRGIISMITGRGRVMGMLFYKNLVLCSSFSSSSNYNYNTNNNNKMKEIIK